MPSLKLPAVLTDHAVLQHSRAIPVWGWTEPGTHVSISFRGQHASCIAGPDGRFQVSVDSQTPGGPFELVIHCADDVTTVHDLLVGEVWLCSGQSNMEWPLRDSSDAEADLAQSRRLQMRLLLVPQAPADAPATDVNAKWACCMPETAAAFSGVAYHFGRVLHQNLDVPIGLIQSAWGGTTCEAWTSKEALQAEPSLRYLAQLEAPVGPHEDPGISQEASGLFNGMIAPLIPFPIAGAIWYQGESNVDRAFEYRKLFPAMIQCWRDSWHDEFAFLFVLLAGWHAHPSDPGESKIAELRDAQLAGLALPATAAASAIDLGDIEDVHPRNKREVGLRLALAALAKHYGRDTECSGPVLEGISLEGSEARLTFSHADDLHARGGHAAGFAVANDNGQFVWGQAHLQGNDVVLRHPEGNSIRYVRYNWADNPLGNLYNSAGLPMLPFRTDSQAYTTAPIAEEYGRLG